MYVFYHVEFKRWNLIRFLHGHALRKLYFYFLSRWMGYDRGDSFPFDFEPNGIPFGSNRKQNCHHDHIPFSVKGNRNIVLSVCSVFSSVLIFYIKFNYYYLFLLIKRVYSLLYSPACWRCLCPKHVHLKSTNSDMFISCRHCQQ